MMWTKLWMCSVFMMCSVEYLRAKKEKDLFILGLFPMNGPWAGGQVMLPGAQMAIEHINSRQDILPKHNLHLIWNDTMCNPGRAVNIMFDLLYSSPIKIMIIGDGCSFVCEATAEAAAYWNVNQMSYGCAAPTLSNKKKYPYFFRSTSPDTEVVPVRVKLMYEFGWKKVATLHQSHPLFSTVTDAFVAELPLHNFTLISSEIFKDDPAIQIANLKKHDARIIFGGFYENMAHKVFCEAYKAGLYGPKYVWTVPGWFNAAWWLKDHKNTNCTIEQISKAAEGHIAAKAIYMNVEDVTGISGMTPDQYLETLGKRTNHATLFAQHMAGVGYDAVWTIALALNATAAQLNDTGLENFTYSDVAMANMIRSNMRKTGYLGMKGWNQFDEHQNGIETRMIAQMQNDTIVNTGIYRPYLPAKERLAWYPGAPLDWRGDKVPVDASVILIEKVEIPLSLYATICSIAGLGIFLTLALLTYNTVNRQKKIIKMSSPNLNNIILIGCLSSYITVFCESVGSPNFIVETCKARNYALTIAFALSFGALFSKTWRVHRIFTNKKAQRRVIKDVQLIMMVFSILSIDIIVLVIWDVLDPLTVIVYDLELAESDYDVDVLIQKQVDLCESPNEIYFIGCLYIIQGVLLIFGAFLAWETKKVKVAALNDSQQIGICIYNVTVLSIVGVTISMILKYQPVASYGLQSGFVIFATITTECTIFVPKLRSIAVGDESIGATTNTGATGTFNTYALTEERTKHAKEVDVLKTEIKELKNKIALLEEERTKFDVNIVEKS